MESTDHSAEADPLKSGEDGTAPSPGMLKKKSCRESLGLAKLSHWRTAIFFLSLFLCLTIVFAFSFVIPCPVRPQYLSTWNRTFPQADTYDFLAIEDASRDKVMDVIFVLKDKEGSQNNTCDSADLPTPCVFVVALAGTDGQTLWERRLAPEYHWAQCSIDEGTDKDWGCLLSHSDQLTAIDKYTGEVKWKQPQPPGLSKSLPALSVPDLDGDKVHEVALVARDTTQLVFLSGKTGFQVGSEVVLDSAETTGLLLHTTAKNSHYVLFRRDTGLYGLALQKIAAKAGVEASLSEDKHWESKASAPFGLVPVYKSDSLRHVLKLVKKGDLSDLLLVTTDEVVLISGKDLQTLWRFNTSGVISEPSFGHFNKDGLLDVVVEEDIGNATKRVVILDGKSGGVLWEVSLLASTNSPKPASVHTINSISVFMFWGLMPSEANSSVPLAEDRRSYMLYPHFAKVLLESTNVVDHIVTFKATLLERGRHACYILLTNTGSERSDSAVVISKRKLKQDVPTSRVLRMGGGGGETNDDIKEVFNRLRFSDD
ncbi:protein FAM234A [Lampris incognitus]|uniref:protein FAM234A n=1 Tax=Lampris incognitus TaxID=2546036 RepID=UPI0024B4F50F|nr:protein FAM234A [Lampris incognitus]